MSVYLFRINESNNFKLIKKIYINILFTKLTLLLILFILILKHKIIILLFKLNFYRKLNLYSHSKIESGKLCNYQSLNYKELFFLF